MIFIEGLLEPLRGWVKIFQAKNTTGSYHEDPRYGRHSPQEDIGFLSHRKVRCQNLPIRHGQGRIGWMRKIEES
jgi:hypothetical protein